MIFGKERPKTAFACYRCKEVFYGKPFTSWSGGGITISENSTDICLHCAGRVAIEEGEEMLRGKNSEAAK